MPMLKRPKYKKYSFKNIKYNIEKAISNVIRREKSENTDAIMININIFKLHLGMSLFINKKNV